MHDNNNKGVQPCIHFPKAILLRNLSNSGKEFQKLQEMIKKKTLKCQTCLQMIEKPWLCIACQAAICDHNSLNMLFTHSKVLNQNEHTVFINVYSCEIICTICKNEVLDFEQYGKTGNEEEFKSWVNPQRIRLEYHHLYKYLPQIFNCSIDIILNQKQAVQNNFNICGILNIANSGYINCIIQVVFGIKPIQQVFKRVHGVCENQHYDAKSKRKNLIRYLSIISENMRSNNHKIINATEILKTLCLVNRQFAGYSQKDCFDFFKFLVNFIHEEFKYVNSIKYDSDVKFVNNTPIEEDWNIIENISQFKDYSLIRTTFKGKLEAQIKCLQCHTLHNNIEEFLGLSLEIPLRNKRQSLLGSFAQNFGIGKKNIPSITLEECFKNFFQPDQSQQGQQYLCSSCKTNVVFQKSYSFKNLPNIMVIHIQRFHEEREKDNTHIEFPIGPYDFGQLLQLTNSQGVVIRKYFKLRAVIVHLSSELGDHYETILVQNGEYISVKDEVVKQVQEKYLLQSNAYMLFYDQLPDKQYESIKKNLKANRNLIKEGAVKFTPEQLCFLPGFWYQSFLHMAQPSMIITSHLLCQHGQLKPDYSDCFDQKIEEEKQILNQSVSHDPNASFYQNIDQSIMQPYNNYSSLENLKLNSQIIPTPVGQFLCEQFGGGPVIPCTIQTCEVCIENAQLMRRRRRLERALIAKYDSLNEPTNYIVPISWINQWEKYLYAAKMQIKKNYILGLPPPPKINNSELLDSKRKLISNIQEGTHYKLVSANIWKILQSIYEGGPTIILKDNDESPQMGGNKTPLDQEDYKMIEEIKNIQTQCKNQTEILKGNFKNSL